MTCPLLLVMFEQTRALEGLHLVGGILNFGMNKRDPNSGARNTKPALTCPQSTTSVSGLW